jgi:hypothetical protein
MLHLVMAIRVRIAVAVIKRRLVVVKKISVIALNLKVSVIVAMLNAKMASVNVRMGQTVGGISVHVAIRSN